MAGRPRAPATGSLRRARELPVSVAYPIWTAIGSLGTVFLGVLLLGESLTAVKLISVGLIVAGVAGLK